MNRTNGALCAGMLGCCAQLAAPSAVAQSTESAPEVSQSDDSTRGVPVNAEHTNVARQERVAFTVHVASPGMRFDVLADSDEILENCVERCQLELPKGSYKVRELDANGEEVRTIDFDVNNAGRVDITDPDSTTSWVGLALGVAGTAMVPLGGALILRGFCMDNCHDQTDTTSLGTVLIVTGLVLAPVGWVTFGLNRRAKVNYLDANDVRIGLAPTPGGASFGIAGRF